MFSHRNEKLNEMIVVHGLEFQGPFSDVSKIYISLSNSSSFLKMILNICRNPRESLIISAKKSL